jgi:hypothetical protein
VFVRGLEAFGHLLDGAAEAGEAEAVAGGEAVEDREQRALRGGDAVAAHGAGAVEQDLEGERALLGGVGGEHRARQADVAVAVAGDECRAGRRPGRSRGRSRGRGSRCVRGTRRGRVAGCDGDAVRGGADGGGVREAGEVEADVERVFAQEVHAGHGGAFEAGGARVAVARGDHRGDGEAQVTVVRLEQFGVAVADDGGLAGAEVAEADGVETVAVVFDEGGGVALVDGALVFLGGFGAGDRVGGERRSPSSSSSPAARRAAAAGR